MDEVRVVQAVPIFENVSDRKVIPIVDYRPRQPLDPRLADARERLARHEPGGSPALPIDVESASQIEVRAEGTPCLRCQAPNRVDEHTAETVGGDRAGRRPEGHTRLSPW
jgi:hypothetical protein